MRGIFAAKNQNECSEISFKFDFTLQESEVLQTTTKKKKNKKKKKKKNIDKSGIICNNASETPLKDGDREDTASESEHEQIIIEISSTIPLSVLVNSPKSMIAKTQTGDLIQSEELNNNSKKPESNNSNSNSNNPVSDKKKKKKKKKGAKNKSKPEVSDDDFEHVINEFKSANISSSLNVVDSYNFTANSTKAFVNNNAVDKQRDKSIPHFLSANDPELSEEAKRQAKYGNGKNLVAIGPAKKKDVSWLESKQSDSNFSNSSNSSTTSHHCSPFTFSFNGIL